MGAFHVRCGYTGKRVCTCSLYVTAMVWDAGSSAAYGARAEALAEALAQQERDGGACAALGDTRDVMVAAKKIGLPRMVTGRPRAPGRPNREERRGRPARVRREGAEGDAGAGRGGKGRAREEGKDKEKGKEKEKEGKVKVKEGRAKEGKSKEAKGEAGGPEASPKEREPAAAPPAWPLSQAGLDAGGRPEAPASREDGACERCAQGGRDVTCGNCGGAYHAGCAGLGKGGWGRSAAKAGTWACQRCTACACCGARWSAAAFAKGRYGSSLCDGCAKGFDKQSYCPVCLRVWKAKDEDAADMIGCDACPLWCHAKCVASLPGAAPAKGQEDWQCPCCRGLVPAVGSEGVAAAALFAKAYPNAAPPRTAAAADGEGARKAKKPRKGADSAGGGGGGGGSGGGGGTPRADKRKGGPEAPAAGGASAPGGEAAREAGSEPPEAKVPKIRIKVGRPSVSLPPAIGPYLSESDLRVKNVGREIEMENEDGTPGPRGELRKVDAKKRTLVLALSSGQELTYSTRADRVRYVTH